MTAHRIPGNEPDTTDMSQEPKPANGAALADLSNAESAEEEEAIKLGDFA